MQPPPLPLAEDEPLYEAFYGFREAPFALSTDPRFFFLSGAHNQAYEELLTGLRRHEGILLLTGESGTGKTTLCRALLDAIGPRTFAALIANPYMSDSEVVRTILRQFGLVSRDEIRRGALARADMPQLLDALETFLRSLVPLNSQAVLFMDEAQSLPPVVLDQIRILAGFEQGNRRLLQVVLVGQPALADTVRAESLRALNERITRRTELTPLTAAEVDHYIGHRLAVAGGRKAVTFEPEAVRLIADLSRGLPRRVNLICDRALEEGRAARSSVIDASMIRRAARAIVGSFDLAVAVDTTSLGRPVPTPAAAEAPAAEASAAEPAAVEAAAMNRPLTFGQTPSRRGGTRAKILLVTLGLALAVGAAAAGYGVWTIGSREIALPPAPAAPRLDIGRAPTEVQVPTEEEIEIGPRGGPTGTTAAGRASRTTASARRTSAGRTPKTAVRIAARGLSATYAD